MFPLPDGFPVPVPWEHPDGDDAEGDCFDVRPSAQEELEGLPPQLSALPRGLIQGNILLILWLAIYALYHTMELPRLRLPVLC